MKEFRVHTGIVAPLDRADVDTDQILPKQFLKRIERTRFGQFLFHDSRFSLAGEPNREFVLNQPRYRSASILLTGGNFGCGSSREHAPWALEDYGFRAIIASSFADIFFNNCFLNGLLPVVLTKTEVAELMHLTERKLDYKLTVDLDSCTVKDGLGFSASFAVDSFRRHCLQNGLDDIALTLQCESVHRCL